MADTHPLMFTGQGAFQPRRSNDYDRGDQAQIENTHALKNDLGPRWSSEEIQLFFETFKRSGKDWQNILNEFHMQGFTHRTRDQIKSLYSKHKTYLKLPSASAKDLTAIMTDYYKSLNLEKQRQMQQKQNMKQAQEQIGLVKEDFICNENIKQVKLPRRSSGIAVRPGYSSSSESQDIEENKSSEPENYQDNIPSRQQSYQNFIPIGRNPNQGGGVFRPQISHRNERFPNQAPEMYDHEMGSNQYDNYDDNGSQINTPSRMKKKTIYPTGLPQRRLFSQNASPMRGHQFGQQQIGTGIRIGNGGQLKGQNQFGNHKDYDNYQATKLNTKQKRQIKANKSICRRGVQEMNPYIMVQDDQDTGAQLSKNIPNPPSSIEYSKLVTRWMRCEYFYSWIDRPYYLSNDFKQLLTKAELENTKLNQLEWSLVRRALASSRGIKPRRFSDRFIQDEKLKIQNYRDIFREIIKSMQLKTFVPDQNGDLSMLLFDKKPQFEEERVKEVLQIIKVYQIAPLVVGQRVLALHPKVNELRTASLLTTDVQSYHAQFDRPELKVIIITDQQLIPISENVIHRVRDNNQGQIVSQSSLSNPFQPPNIQMDDEDGNFIPFEHTQFSKDNIKAMALLIILFERKNRLINEIRALNDQYLRLPSYTEDFRQKYAWTAIQLQATNSIIEPVLTMFRYRQIKPEFLSLYEDQMNEQDEKMTNEGTEEFVSGQVFKQAQTLYDADYIEVKKNFNPNCQDFDNQIYEGLDNKEEEDVEMKIEDESITEQNPRAESINYERTPQIALQTQEMYSTLKSLQNYYKIITPSLVINQQQENANDQSNDQYKSQSNYKINLDSVVLEEILVNCKKGNEEQINGNIASILENLIPGDQKSIEILNKIDVAIANFQQKLHEKAQDILLQ
ncbi:protein always early 2-like [Stylonychia lemnae]|uniref:Protein always early 2-like n=1 Tax=Stylonychia lemnae TaxID=5949 RepID=A0A078AVR6_STYLE|nr:protein always early 2-like [Stylonychia lemnae]|eukprot:CDW86505.1 protein always early 2-like [Stylonychia lemnae]